MTTKRLKGLLALLLVMTLMMGNTIAAQAASTSAKTITLLRSEGSNITVKSGSGRVLSARDKMTLYNGYSVSTGADSYVYLMLDNTKAIKLDKNTSVNIEKEGDKNEVNLVNGSLLFNITQKLTSNETLNIKTSNTTMGIRGTIGLISHTVGSLTPSDAPADQNRSQTQITLLEGSVNVTVNYQIGGNTPTSGAEPGSTDPDNNPPGTTQTIPINAGQTLNIDTDNTGDTATDTRPLDMSDISSFAADEMVNNDDMRQRVENSLTDTSTINPSEPPDWDKIEKENEDKEKENTKRIEENKEKVSTNITQGITFSDSDGIDQAVESTGTVTPTITITPTPYVSSEPDNTSIPTPIQSPSEPSSGPEPSDTPSPTEGSTPSPTEGGSTPIPLPSGLPDMVVITPIPDTTSFSAKQINTAFLTNKIVLLKSETGANHTIDADPDVDTITIPADHTLETPANVELENKTKLVNNGLLVITKPYISNETINNNGTIKTMEGIQVKKPITNNGTIDVGGSFTNEAEITNTGTIQLGALDKSVTNYINEVKLDNTNGIFTMNNALFENKGIVLSGNMALINGSTFRNHPQASFTNCLYENASKEKPGLLSISEDSLFTNMSGSDTKPGGAFTNNGSIYLAASVDESRGFHNGTGNESLSEKALAVFVNRENGMINAKDSDKKGFTNELNGYLRNYSTNGFSFSSKNGVFDNKAAETPIIYDGDERGLAPTTKTITFTYADGAQYYSFVGDGDFNQETYVISSKIFIPAYLPQLKFYGWNKDIFSIIAKDFTNCDLTIDECPSVEGDNGIDCTLSATYSVAGSTDTVTYLYGTKFNTALVCDSGIVDKLQKITEWENSYVSNIAPRVNYESMLLHKDLVLNNILSETDISLGNIIYLGVPKDYNYPLTTNDNESSNDERSFTYLLNGHTIDFSDIDSNVRDDSNGIPLVFSGSKSIDKTLPPISVPNSKIKNTASVPAMYNAHFKYITLELESSIETERFSLDNCTINACGGSLIATGATPSLITASTIKTITGSAITIDSSVVDIGDKTCFIVEDGAAAITVTGSHSSVSFSGFIDVGATGNIVRLDTSCTYSTVELPKSGKEVILSHSFSVSNRYFVYFDDVSKECNKLTYDNGKVKLKDGSMFDAKYLTNKGGSGTASTN